MEGLPEEADCQLRCGGERPSRQASGSGGRASPPHLQGMATVFAMAQARSAGKRWDSLLGGGTEANYKHLLSRRTSGDLE